MSAVKQNAHEPFFQRMVIASVALHFAVLISFTVRTYLFPEDALNLDSAIRVDIVALPEKNKQIPAPDLKPTEPDTKAAPEPPKEAAKPVEKPKPKEAAPKLNLNAKKKAKQDALEKIKAMQALDNIQNEVKKEEDDDKEKKKKQQAAQVKGNVLSKGGALKGIVSTQLAGYVDDLKRHANSHWTIPQWLSDLNLKARAVVFLNEDGTVDRRMIVESSGNETYDNMVLATIDQASPFPTPPKHFVDLVKIKGIQLGFPE
jgi:TonB family protein